MNHNLSTQQRYRQHTKIKTPPPPLPSSSKQGWLWGLGFVLMVLLGGVGWGVWWHHQPVGKALQVEIPQGATHADIAQILTQTGWSEPHWVRLWLRFMTQHGSIKAGTYEFSANLSPQQRLQKLIRGEQALITVTLIEGKTFAHVLQQLQKNPALVQDADQLATKDWVKKLGLTVNYTEGSLFPDTYRIPKGSSVTTVLKLAARTQRERLAKVWQQREPNTPLQSMEEALILASIIEKETGQASDRPMIASVFVNRLRKGMRLQTDPTVIYGLGDAFDGNLRKTDLQTDTPFNTYTRSGLPPTPIALPGYASLMAAVQPASSDKLYFVAKGNGASYFSATLDEHNAAVRKYQLGK